MKSRILTSIYVAIFIVGCQSMDATLSPRGVIETSTSKIDGTTVVEMSPVLSKHGLSDIQAEFGLYWDSIKGDNALLIIEIDGANNFDPSKPFEIRVDGELFKLSPASSRDYGDIETKHNSIDGYHNKSRKYYIIGKNQILNIANGSEAYYRVWFLKNTYAEGEISYQYKDYQSYIPASFRKFYSQIWGNND